MDPTLQFAPSPMNGQSVEVRLPGDVVFFIPITHEFDEAAAQIAERVQNRGRWRRSEIAKLQTAEMCLEHLKRLGLDPNDELAAIANSGLIELGIPEDCGNAARLFPWEFAISQAVRTLRGVRSPLVLRHLVRKKKNPRNPARPQSLLIVQSAPGAISEEYSFDSERRLVQSSCNSLKALTLKDPTLNELQSVVSTNKPGLIHFTGIDNLQGAALLGESNELPRGMFFADQQRNPVPINAHSLASSATAGATKPALVSYNTYNSAWPLAAETVQLGAAAAVGVQDEIDDALAELFFARLYESYQRLEWNLFAAFRETWRALSDYGEKLEGTGSFFG